MLPNSKKLIGSSQEDVNIAATEFVFIEVAGQPIEQARQLFQEW